MFLLTVHVQFIQLISGADNSDTSPLLTLHAHGARGSETKYARAV